MDYWFHSFCPCFTFSFYIKGIYQIVLSKATYNMYIYQKKEKQQYIAVVIHDTMHINKLQ